MKRLEKRKRAGPSGVCVNIECFSWLGVHTHLAAAAVPSLERKTNLNFRGRSEKVVSRVPDAAGAACVINAGI